MRAASACRSAATAALRRPQHAAGTVLLRRPSADWNAVPRRTLVQSTALHKAAPGSLVHELQELTTLHEAGGLTDDEFKDAKAALISSKKNVHFTSDGPHADSPPAAPKKLPKGANKTVQEEADKRMADEMGTQAVAMRGLADSGFGGESGIGEALSHVALEEAGKGNEPGVKFREMPGGGGGFAPGKARKHRVADEEALRRIGGGEVVRQRVAAKLEAARDESMSPIDAAKAEELGLELCHDEEPDPDRVSAFYLRIACRMIGAPGQPPTEVSTNSAKTVLGDNLLEFASMTQDVKNECVVVITPPDTSESVVRKTLTAIIKQNGSVTFGPELIDPIMYRIVEQD